ncbi:MAG: AmmeMemoRadiSam system protein B [Bacteroidales bacterium]|nr:AmmeMemoRadiSam system protein B [Bacteroidales bacterium]
MKTRRPAVAGRFYPATAPEIKKQLSEILNKERQFIDISLSQKEIIGAVVPHAGYMFSGYQAIHFFEILKNTNQQFDTFFIINPNHTGYGSEISLDENDSWETPFGRVDIDYDYYDLLDFAESASAHKFEHAGEVILPLLQNHLDYPFRIVPITMSRQTTDNARFIAQNIFKANALLKKKICLIASSDFSHFVHPGEGRELDRFVINEILKMNPAGVYKEVKDRDISVCGFGPIMTLMEYAKLVSENPQARILKIGHSGEVMPSSEVVDYVSILIYNEA